MPRRFASSRREPDGRGEVPWRDPASSLRSIDRLPVLIYRIALRPERRVEYINETSTLLLGYTPAELCEDIGAMDRLVHAADRKLWASLLEQAPAPSTRPVRLRLVHRDGRTLWTEHRIARLLDDDPGGSAIEGVAIDVSAQKETEAELRTLTRRLNDAQRIARIGNWEWDIKDDHLWWSDEVFRIFGLSRDRFGCSYEAFLEAVHADDRGAVEAAVETALKSRASYSIDHRIVLPDGAEKIVHEEAEVTYGRDGVATRMVGTVHDITARRAAEEALRASEARLIALLNALPDIIFRLDADGVFLAFHGPPNAPLAFSEKEFLGRKVGDLFPPDHAERALACIERTLATGDMQTFEYELQIKGERRLFESRYVRAADNEIVAVIRDTTEQNEAIRQIEELKERLLRENVLLRQDVRTAGAFEGVVGTSAKLEGCLQLARTVAPTDVPVLLLGETGTGKELFARAIHQLSARRQHPLISVNCPALPAEIIESELFGHERGAFTSAVNRRIGRFEAASGGSLFLDEIGDLPLELQGKLLRVLQEKEFERVGGSAPIRTNVRLIAATNKNLEDMVKRGEFRADLYYRIANFPIVLPPLRERVEDIALLAEHFVRKHAALLRKDVNTISAPLLAHLERSPWHGNVRELEGYVIRLILTATGHTLELPEDEALGSVAANAGANGTAVSLDDAERRHILMVLDRTRWVITGQRGAAQALALPPSTLRSKMARLGIRRPTRVDRPSLA